MSSSSSQSNSQNHSQSSNTNQQGNVFPHQIGTFDPSQMPNTSQGQNHQVRQLFPPLDNQSQSQTHGYYFYYPNQGYYPQFDGYTGSYPQPGNPYYSSQTCFTGGSSSITPMQVISKELNPVLTRSNAWTHGKEKSTRKMASIPIIVEDIAQAEELNPVLTRSNTRGRQSLKERRHRHLL
ncbi:hypothetical protein GIB67_039546 [Kingdonia uniflora]|uniref:Uncharacterized protein n=1 Tax=Kingdonia uniflora TaxID=39325 RepID=A0A7J7LJ62_9MAGN|nr:hypothetical protein GIB67_039546 [Kingdonia uniflora]